MIKITNHPIGEIPGFTIAFRKKHQDAWIPVQIDIIRIDLIMHHEIANNMHKLSNEGVTHFINNGGITFFRGDSPYCVMNKNVQALQVYAENIEARITKVSEVL